MSAKLCCVGGAVVAEKAVICSVVPPWPLDGCHVRLGMRGARAPTGSPRTDRSVQMSALGRKQGAPEQSAMLQKPDAEGGLSWCPCLHHRHRQRPAPPNSHKHEHGQHPTQRLKVGKRPRSHKRRARRPTEKQRNSTDHTKLSTGASARTHLLPSIALAPFLSIAVLLLFTILARGHVVVAVSVALIAVAVAFPAVLCAPHKETPHAGEPRRAQPQQTRAQQGRLLFSADAHRRLRNKSTAQNSDTFTRETHTHRRRRFRRACQWRTRRIRRRPRRRR